MQDVLLHRRWTPSTVEGVPESSPDCENGGFAVRRVAHPANGRRGSLLGELVSPLGDGKAADPSTPMDRSPARMVPRDCEILPLSFPFTGKSRQRLASRYARRRAGLGTVGRLRLTICPKPDRISVSGVIGSASTVHPLTCGIRALSGQAIRRDSEKSGPSDFVSVLPPHAPPVKSFLPIPV